ncbi:MAG: CAP domain-containing protein [Cyclobacteriaceae bacterium]|nr:CAP domain-containing protein [Cyclobacteriaceae bacterium]
MKLIVICLLTLFLCTASGTQTDNCLSAEELKLYRLLNDYRKSLQLPVIPLSRNLSVVAQIHVRDLAENNPVTGPCNLHSWSSKGKWKPCCYTSDHKEAQCMWDKPRELSRYAGDGYEISYYHSDKVRAEEALETWKKSEGHHQVIINRGIWKQVTWRAVGVGIYGNYGVIWFGKEPDEETCEAGR